MNIKPNEGLDDNEVLLHIDGGSTSKDYNTGAARFKVTIISDEELSHSERKEMLSELIGMEFIAELDDGE